MSGMHSRKQMLQWKEQDCSREWAVWCAGWAGADCELWGPQDPEGDGSHGFGICTWNGGGFGQCVQSLVCTGRLSEQDRCQTWPCHAIAKEVERRAWELPEGQLLPQGEAGKLGWRW